MLDIRLMKQLVKIGTITASLFFSNFAPAQSPPVPPLNQPSNEAFRVPQRSVPNPLAAGGTNAAGAGGRSKFETNTLNIVYLDDSITQGVSLPDSDQQPPPATCTAFLRTHLHGASFEFANIGRNGHTTADFLPATNTDFAQAEEAAHRLQTNDEGALLF